MEFDPQWLLGLLVIPIGYFFKRNEARHGGHDDKFDEHDKRMDSQERHVANHYVCREDWQRELDRTNKIVGQLFERKADKELLEARLND